MKNLAEQVGNVIDGLDQSQNTVEEMAFILLNSVDHVKKHNEELKWLVDLISEADSEEATEEVIQAIKIISKKISRAMDRLVENVYKNEEAAMEQRKYVEEAKQVVDFLQCSMEWDKVL